MNKLFHILAITLFFYSLNCIAQEIPSIKPAGKKVEDFLPKGWDIIGQAKGDLNRDGIEDAAVVIKDIEEDLNSEVNYTRLLLVLIRNKDKTLNLSLSSEKAILCKHCGGVYGDPFESLDIKNNTLIIGHYGGSNQRWAIIDSFKLQGMDWIVTEEKNASMESSNPDDTYREIVKNQKELAGKKISDYDINKRFSN